MRLTPTLVVLSLTTLAFSTGCGGSESNHPTRVVVYRAVVSAKLTSSLAGVFTLNFGQQRFPLAVQYGDGQQRCWGLGEAGYASLTMSPGTTVSVDTWLVGDAVKTPQYPNGDPAYLRQAVFGPAMYVGTKEFGERAVVDYAYGPRVLVCNLQDACSVPAGVFADPAAFANGDSALTE